MFQHHGTQRQQANSGAFATTDRINAQLRGTTTCYRRQQQTPRKQTASTSSVNMMSYSPQKAYSFNTAIATSGTGNRYRQKLMEFTQGAAHNVQPYERQAMSHRSQTCPH